MNGKTKKTISMTAYRKWDILLVPFPFTDLTSAKKRPALVVSPDVYNRSGPDLVIAFITSQTDVRPRPGDYRIRTWKESGLPKPSLLRMKFATIDREIVLKKIGRLQQAEQSNVRGVLAEFFAES
jgi:mRNA interferase MazF